MSVNQETLENFLCKTAKLGIIVDTKKTKFTLAFYYLVKSYMY